MTGFGKAVCEYQNNKITIELKSLNSKQLDFYPKIPSCYKEKELFFRNMIMKRLERGKVELFIRISSGDGNKISKINKTAFANYLAQIKEISNEQDIKVLDETLFNSILQLPDVLTQEAKEIAKEEWKELETSVNKAIEDLIGFRKQEGEALQKDILERIKNIIELKNKIPQYEEKRIEAVKQRIQQHLSDVLKDKKYDENRFEQEMIYYLEKIDITEEKVRLENHCSFFIKTVENEFPAGKKLGFISQEIGREINTIGSKANDVDIQQIVVRMKDELEKIKEQLLNVL